MRKPLTRKGHSFYFRRARRDSNTRPLAPQASALSKLSYERTKKPTVRLLHHRPGGEAGIRTLGRALKALQALSRRPRSATPAPPQGKGGGRGIRTPGEVAPTAVLKTAALNHSAIPPRYCGQAS